MIQKNKLFSINVKHHVRQALIPALVLTLMLILIAGVFSSPAYALTAMTSDDWFEKGNTYLDAGDYYSAIEAYDYALSLDSYYADAWNNKGLALSNLGQYEGAINAYDRALSIDTYHPHAWYNKGNALSDLGRYKEAIEAYGWAVSIDPNDADAWNNKGVAYYNLGQYEDAIDLYETAISIDPNHAYAWDNKETALADLRQYGERGGDYRGSDKIDTVDTYDPYPYDPYGSSNDSAETIIGIIVLIIAAVFIMFILIFVARISNKKKRRKDENRVHDAVLDSKKTDFIDERDTQPLTPAPAQGPVPSQSTITKNAPEILSAIGYKGATIIYKVKVQNPTSEPMGDIKVTLFVPDVFLLSESTKSISMLKPDEGKTVTFEIRPTGECGDCQVSGKVTYYDYAVKTTKDTEIPARNLSIICPMLQSKEIDKSTWRHTVSKLVKAEESTKDIDMPAATLFDITCDVLRDMNLYMLEPKVSDSSTLYRATAHFYGEGVKELQYAAQAEVIGGAKKSKLILKAWAEREDALVGFYHGVLDEIEKRMNVKQYIDTPAVQQFYHYGDNVSTQVRDSVVQRSKIGADPDAQEDIRKCSGCGREVEDNERFCHECGERLK